MSEPNNTTTAYGFSQMRTERPPATSPPRDCVDGNWSRAVLLLGCCGEYPVFCAGVTMSIIPEVIPSADISQSDFDNICDAIEAEIVRLQNIDYASPEAQALLDFEAEIVAQRYEAQS